MLDTLSTLTSTDPVDFVEWYEKLGQELQIYGFGFTPHNALILANGGIGCCPSSLGYFTESGELLMRIVPRLLANLRRNEDINNLINHAETQSNNAYELIFAIGILLKLWDITEAVNAPTMPASTNLWAFAKSIRLYYTLLRMRGQPLSPLEGVKMLLKGCVSVPRFT